MNYLGSRERSDLGRRGVIVGALLLTLGIGVGKPQHPGSPNTGQLPPTQTQLPDVSGKAEKDKDSEPNLRSMSERQALLRNSERQKRLVSDTDRLLALATQLHDDVAKTDKNILSVEVVRRADEIEKLARSVKDRMRE